MNPNDERPPGKCHVSIALRHLATALSEAAGCIVMLRQRILEIDAAILQEPTLPHQQFKVEMPAVSQTALDSETNSHVPTKTAAALLNRSPQTLRKWACYENGPLRPIRINGRLAWPVSELRKILNCDV